MLFDLDSIPEGILNLWVVLFGLIVGSFLNVVIARVPERKSLWSPGSSCPSCQTKIAWRDNIPVVSWLLLRGKCRSCSSKISVRYPVVELLTALLFLAVFLRQGPGLMTWVRDLPFTALLIAITFIDLDHRLILDRMSFPGLLFGLAAAHWVPGFSLLDAVLGAAFGFIFFYLLALAYVRMTGKVGLGGGDVKLLTMLGAYIGVSGVFATVFISSIVGSVIGILWGVLSKEKQLMKTAIPFGPFLVLGALTYFLIGSHLWKEWTGI